MNKKVLKSIFMLIIMLFCMLYATTVLAAGNFTLSKSSATITEGKTTTFSINGSSATGRVDITSSNTSVATVSSSNEWLEGNSKTITITAKKTGTATITVAGTVADEEGAEATIEETVKVTVKADVTSNSSSSTSNNNNSSSSSSDTTTTKTKSSNAYLSTLGVTPKEYDFSGFSKTKTSYSVTVPSDVDSLKVIAKPADSNATVKVTGNSGFEVGSNNKITIKVTAEDGKTTKTYTIKVTKLAEEEEKPGNLIEEDTDLYLTSLSIDDLELSPEFAKDTYSYVATLSNSDITDLDVEAKANNKKANIDISGNTGLVEGENTINIILTLDDSSIQTVYQIVVTKEAAAVTTTSDDTTTSGTDLIGTIKNYAVIAIAVIVLMIVAVIVLIVLLRKENKRLREEDIVDEESNKEEYNVYKNDINEFENKDNEPNNFIESLYRQRNGNLYNPEELDEQEKETLEEINRQTDEIFRDKVQGQSVEYDNTEFEKENPLEERRKRRGKGKHSI